MVYGIILSGGIGSRMQSGNLPKQYIEIKDTPVLIYTIRAFDRSPHIDHIVVVANEEWHGQIRQWVSQHGIQKPVTLTQNGDNRQNSIISGLRACAAIRTPADEDKVLVHDAVRPFVSQRIIADCVSALDQSSCCLTAIPDYDTTYISLDGETIADQIDRSKLVMGQTPEGFALKQYLELNEAATTQELEHLHGGCELMFMRGYPIQLVLGSPLNLKLTRPDDLTLFQALFDSNAL